MTSIQFIPFKDSSVVFCACSVIGVSPLGVVRAVHKFDFKLVIY